jgi:hypothetical protein
MLLGFETPPDMTVSADKNLLATAIAAAVWLGVVIWGMRLGRKYATAIPLILVAGGAITYGYEPLVDNLGKCWLPEHHQWTLFTTFGRSMPVYGVFVYSAFFGGFAILSWAHLKGGGAPSGLWRKFALAMFINAFLFESPAIWADFYTYYGNQPFNPWGFPLWWPFVNCAGPIALGALLYALDAYGGIARRWLYATAFIGQPVFNGFSNGGAGLPTWAALNSDVSTFVVWVAGTVTILLGCLFVLATVKGLELLQRRAGLPPPPSAEPWDAERVPAYG